MRRRYRRTTRGYAARVQLRRQRSIEGAHGSFRRRHGACRRTLSPHKPRLLYNTHQSPILLSQMAMKTLRRFKFPVDDRTRSTEPPLPLILSSMSTAREQYLIHSLVRSRSSQSSRPHESHVDGCSVVRRRFITRYPDQPWQYIDQSQPLNISPSSVFPDADAIWKSVRTRYPTS